MFSNRILIDYRGLECVLYLIGDFNLSQALSWDLDFCIMIIEGPRRFFIFPIFNKWFYVQIWTVFIYSLILCA